MAHDDDNHIDDDDGIDEVVLNVLLAEGLDPATAWAAAQRDTPTDHSSPLPVNRWAILIGLIILIAWLLLR